MNKSVFWNIWFEVTTRDLISIRTLFLNSQSIVYTKIVISTYSLYICDARNLKKKSIMFSNKSVTKTSFFPKINSLILVKLFI